MPVKTRQIQLKKRDTGDLESLIAMIMKELGKGPGEYGMAGKPRAPTADRRRGAAAGVIRRWSGPYSGPWKALSK